MANAESAILKEIMQSEPTILRKDMLMAYFREAARTTGADTLRAVWDDLFPFKEYLSRVADPYTLETLPYWQYSLAIEWIGSHFIGGDTYDANLVNAKRFLGNIGGYYDYLIARGEMSGRAELDRAIRELCGGKRLKLVKEIPYTGDEFFTEVSKGKKTARFTMSDYWLLLVLAVDYGDDWKDLRLQAEALTAGRGRLVDDLKARMDSLGYSGLQDLVFSNVSEQDIRQAREWFGAEEAERPPELLPVAELKRRHALLKIYDEGDPWQQDGERIVRLLKDALKRYAADLSGLPDQFVPMAMDQYLAALWHSEDRESAREKHRRTRAGDKEYESAYELFNAEPWLYTAFIMLEDLGGGRYHCMDDEENSFMLYSPSLANALKEGSLIFLSLLLSIGDGWYMTHGPIQGWRGLSFSDIGSFASCVARQRYRNDGLDAVVMADPVPFWALGKYGNIPPVFDGDEPVVYCSIRCSLSPDFGESLPRTWRRQDAGKKTRWVYGAGKNLLSRRYVYLDRSQGKAYLAASRLGDCDKLLKFMTPYIELSDEPPAVVGALMVMIQKELLRADGPLAVLEKPFKNFKESD